MDFDIGSNQYRNAKSSIEIDGMGQLVFEHNRRYNETVLRGFIFDRNGGLTAKIADSSLELNIRGEFELFSESSAIKLVRRATQEVLLEIKFLDNDRVQIHQAKLYTGRGRPFEVTPTAWKLADSSHSGEYTDCAGGPVQLM